MFTLTASQSKYYYVFKDTIKIFICYNPFVNLISQLFNIACALIKTKLFESLKNISHVIATRFWITRLAKFIIILSILFYIKKQTRNIFVFVNTRVINERKISKFLCVTAILYKPTAKKFSYLFLVK